MAGARELVDVLLEMGRRHDEVRRVNRDLREAGDPRVVPELDDAARPQKQATKFLLHPLWARGVLPHPTDPLAMLYPRGLDAFGMPAQVAEGAE